MTIKEHRRVTMFPEIEILRLAASSPLIDANRSGKKAELFTQPIFNITNVGKMQFRFRAAG